ncbi:hypothetical protein [Chromobacterium haemolyticum]|uniref:hypothetical protein n=1 Tax=Chromobacterium TaxID=535 RepID=UPI00405609AE
MTPISAAGASIDIIAVALQELATDEQRKSIANSLLNLASERAEPVANQLIVAATLIDIGNKPANDALRERLEKAKEQPHPLPAN